MKLHLPTQRSKSGNQCCDALQGVKLASMRTPGTDFENGLLPAFKGLQSPMLLVHVNGIFLEVMELLNQLLHWLPELEGDTEFFK